MGNNIIKDFEDSLLSVGADVLTELSNLNVEELCKNEIVSQIPVVKTLLSFCKFGAAIYESHLLNQTLTFLQTFNSKTISSKKLQKYKNKIETNPEKAKEEVSRVLLILHRAIDNEKAKILANLFRSFVNEDIDWYIFCDLSDVTDRLFISDLPALKKVYLENEIKYDVLDSYHLDRLIALGLLENQFHLSDHFILDGGNLNMDTSDKADYKITKLGKLLVEYGIAEVNGTDENL